MTPTNDHTDVTRASSGSDGQITLAVGERLGMRMWRDEKPGEPKPATTREYETAGFVLSGRAELHLEGRTIQLGPGDSWIVPRGAPHSYSIVETFSAVEATSPPA